MSTLYYAVGGGLGHLTRAQRVLRTLGVADGLIVTSCNEPCQFPTIRVGEHDSILDVIHAPHPSRLIVDAFPTGIRRELVGVNVPRIDYVARRLRWSEYRRANPEDVQFNTTYVIEDLGPDHLTWIKEHSLSVRRLAAAFLRSSQSGDKPPRSEAGFWLIVHSGPAEEVRDLVEYARDLASTRGECPRVLVATRCDIDLPPGFERTSEIPYARAGRIISAAGFNVMLETEPWSEKHHVVPFPRRFDDQFARAASRKRGLARRIGF